MSRFHRPLVLKNTPSSIPHALKKRKCVCVAVGNTQAAGSVNTAHTGLGNDVLVSVPIYKHPDTRNHTLTARALRDLYQKAPGLLSLSLSLAVSLSHKHGGWGTYRIT
jgi:hypothetical protein